MEYRAARDRLLEQEIELRRAMEAVACREARAAARRSRPGGLRLPGGGSGRRPDRREAVGAVRARQGLARDLQLHVPARSRRRAAGARERSDGATEARGGPVPIVRRLLDQLDGAVEHATQHLNLAVVAKAPLPRILTFAEERGWRRLRLLSSAGNTYNRDYLAETAEGRRGRC